MRIYTLLAFLFISLVAQADSQIYHGLEILRCDNRIKTTYEGASANFNGVGINPYVGMRITPFLSIEGGYFHTSQKAKFSSLVSDKSSSSVVFAKPAHTMLGHHVNLVFHTPKFENSGLRLFASVGLFDSWIRVKFQKTRMFGAENGEETETDRAVTHTLKIRKVFTRLSAGAIHYLTDQCAIKASILVLKPRSVDVHDEQHSLIRQVSHAMHLGIGLHWEWR